MDQPAPCASFHVGVAVSPAEPDGAARDRGHVVVCGGSDRGGQHDRRSPRHQWARGLGHAADLSGHFVAGRTGISRRPVAPANPLLGRAGRVTEQSLGHASRRTAQSVSCRAGGGSLPVEVSPCIAGHAGRLWFLALDHPVDRASGRLHLRRVSNGRPDLPQRDDRGDRSAGRRLGAGCLRCVRHSGGRPLLVARSVHDASLASDLGADAALDGRPFGMGVLGRARRISGRRAASAGDPLTTGHALPTDDACRGPAATGGGNQALPNHEYQLPGVAGAGVAGSRSEFRRATARKPDRRRPDYPPTTGAGSGSGFSCNTVHSQHLATLSVGRGSVGTHGAGARRGLGTAAGTLPGDD